LCPTLQIYRSVVTNAEVCDTRTRPSSPFSTQLAQQRSLVDVEDERPLAVDLDDGQPLAVARLEVGVTRDVDGLVGDAEPVELGARTLAQRAVRRVDEDDARGRGYG
jgi:hypothetical protein